MLSAQILSEKAANCTFRIILHRSFAAAAQPQLQSSGERRLQLPQPAGLKCGRLPSGLFVATVDNNDPVARVSLIFKAGTRYETYENRGVVHRLRNIIGLPTNNRTAIDFNYHVASTGALLTSAATRDHLSFDIQIFRHNTGSAFRILDELFSSPFGVAPHDLAASTPQMLRELNLLKENWPAYCLEKLHKAAYRDQSLGYTLLSPKRAVGHHSAEQVSQFASQHLTTGNAALVATGVEHEDVVAWGTEFFPLAKGAAAPAVDKVTFFAGELRKHQPNTDLAVVYIGAPSVGLNDAKSAVAHAVLANALGVGPLVKWSDGGQTRLAKAAAKATANPFHVSASNIGYDGTGMFTLFYCSQWADSAAVAKAVVGELRAVASKGITEQELQGAKNRVKYRLLSLAENNDYVVEDLAVQAAIRQTDISSTSDQVKLVDSVGTNDVQQLAKNIASGKFAMAAVGRLDKTPYLDEL